LNNDGDVILKLLHRGFEMHHRVASFLMHFTIIIYYIKIKSNQIKLICSHHLVNLAKFTLDWSRNSQPQRNTAVLYTRNTCACTKKQANIQRKTWYIFLRRLRNSQTTVRSLNDGCIAPHTPLYIYVTAPPSRTWFFTFFTPHQAVYMKFKQVHICNHFIYTIRSYTN
jgi:hypothetical protein